MPGLFWMPITATSPSSTRLAVTIPSMGERTVVLASVSRAPSRVARACCTRWDAALAAASAVATAVRARWISASGMIRAAKFSSARRRSERACSRLARADLLVAQERLHRELGAAGGGARVDGVDR